jgi:addiction module HigA family antidote
VNQYVPDVTSPPGETLAEILADRGMSQAELAERMGRPKKTINEILGAKAELTSETALQLERVLGIPASFWSNLERNYRDSMARAQERKQFSLHAKWPDQFPLGQMAKLGWIARKAGPAEAVGELLSFFAVSSIDQWEARYQNEAVAYRRPAKFEPDVYALTAWLRAGEREAESIECGAFDAEGFRSALAQARRLTLEGDPELFVPALRDLSRACGVAVVFIPELAGSRACGVTRWLSPTKALIQLSLRYKSNDHLWFTFFHEAGHVLLHGKREIFLEIAKGRVGNAEREAEADRFAAEMLIPRKDFARLLELAPFSERAVRAFAKETAVAPGIVVGRLQHDKHLPYSHLNKLKLWYTWKHAAD